MTLLTLLIVLTIRSVLRGTRTIPSPPVEVSPFRVLTHPRVMKQPIVRMPLPVTVLDIIPAVRVLVLVRCLCVLDLRNVVRWSFLVLRTRVRPPFLVARTVEVCRFLVLRTRVCPTCLVPTRLDTVVTRLVGGSTLPTLTWATPTF